MREKGWRYWDTHAPPPMDRLVQSALDAFQSALHYRGPGFAGSGGFGARIRDGVVQLRFKGKGNRAYTDVPPGQRWRVEKGPIWSDEEPVRP